MALSVLLQSDHLLCGVKPPIGTASCMPELSVVVPTFNERDNVVPLLGSLSRALQGIDYEVIFVDDDSPDGTADLVRQVAQADPHVRIVHRINRRGLASAVVEGFMASSAPYLAVIDGDMQHDETCLSAMLARLKEGELDLVVGSRNTEGGGMGDFSRRRVKLSNMGRALSQFVCRAQLSDTMSGFFMLTREFLDEVVRLLSNRGFKILLDLVASSRRRVRFAEVPYTFRSRIRGESKLNIQTGIEYIELLIDKLVGEFVPVSYVMFGIVGTIGLGIHLLAVSVLMRACQLSLSSAQVIASSAAIAFNFVLNNQFTYRASRLKGRRLSQGLLLFYVGCAIGLVANWEVAAFLRSQQFPWPLASTVGLGVGSIWNYWVSTMFVWQVSRHRLRHRASTVFKQQARLQHQETSL